MAASLGAIAVVLTNIPAGLGFTMALVAYLVTARPAQRLARFVAVAASLGSGYLLTAPLMPLSGLLLTAQNTQWMDPSGQMTFSKLGGIALGILALAAISYGLQKLGIADFSRFGLAFLAITAFVVLANAWGHFSLFAQSMRFHLVMEMAIVMVVAAALQRVPLRRRTSRIVAGIFVLACVAGQTAQYRFYAGGIIKRGKLEGRSEMKIARWMAAHAEGSRVWVPGSVSFWINALTDTPQLIGCCDQNYLSQSQRIASYEMSSDDGAGADAGRISTFWMRAMGVKYAASCGPRSTEEYHSMRHPHKFDGLLPKVWQDGDDAIFEVSSRPATLAHWIAPVEAVANMPINGTEIAPLQRYVAALEDAGRPTATIRWEGTGSAVIQGAARQGDVLSVQVPFHAGWRAESPSGKRLAIGQDGLGFLLLRTECEGNCTVQLRFDGGREAQILGALCAIAWSVALVLLFREQVWPRLGQARKLA